MEKVTLKRTKGLIFRWEYSFYFEGDYFYGFGITARGAIRDTWSSFASKMSRKDCKELVKRMELST